MPEEPTLQDFIKKVKAKRTFNPLANNSKSGKEIPSIRDTSIKPGSRKNILLLKVPYCVHYGSSVFQKAVNKKDIGKLGWMFSESLQNGAEEESHVETKIKEKIRKDEYSPVQDIKTKTPFKPIPSLAIATLSSFFDKYKTVDYNLKCIDINLLIYDHKQEDDNIDVTKFSQIIEDTIANEDYDILALSAMFVMSQKWVDETMYYSKKYHPNAKVILGGGYPSLFPEYVLKRHGIDVSVVGEGEDTFLNIVNRLNNIEDKKFEKDFPFEGYAALDSSDNSFFVPRSLGFIDLKHLPPASYNWLDVNEYFKKSGNNTLPMEASRGCPYGCTYCHTDITWGRKVRYKTVENLINEIEYNNKNYKPQFHFIDDNMSFDRPWVIEFLDKLAERNLKLFQVTASNFHYKRLDEEILDKLFKVGVESISIALESGSENINRRIHRVLDWDRAKKVVNYVRKRGKASICFWMVGFPGETMEELQETFMKAKEIRSTKALFSKVTPYPGTKLWETGKELEALTTDDRHSLEDPDGMIDLFLYRSSKGIVKSEEWTTESVNNMLYEANIELNFLNSPGLETENEREWLMRQSQNILKSIPEHIVANIMLGYLYHYKKEFTMSNFYYHQATNLFKDDNARSTFQKYIYWDNNKVIKHFLKFFKKENGKLLETIYSENSKDKEFKTHIHEYYY